MVNGPPSKSSPHDGIWKFCSARCIVSANHGCNKFPNQTYHSLTVHEFWICLNSIVFECVSVGNARNSIKLRSKQFATQMWHQLTSGGCCPRAISPKHLESALPNAFQIELQATASERIQRKLAMEISALVREFNHAAIEPHLSPFFFRKVGFEIWDFTTSRNPHYQQMVFCPNLKSSYSWRFAQGGPLTNWPTHDCLPYP